MDLLPRVRATVQRHCMLERGCKVLLAVSGGADSMALLHLLSLLKAEFDIELHVAHLNHMLRGKDAEEDASFVAETAGSYGLPFTVESRDVAAYRAGHRVSAQVAAREVRYRFLAETADKTGAKRVALAHHADDQAETILINFLRGAGVTGLKGIPPVREEFYVRPLMDVRRFEIERYCKELNLPFRQDRSNARLFYERNRIRLELIPLLTREFNPGLVPALLRMGDICREEDGYLEDLAAAALQEVLLESSAARVVLDLNGLAVLPLAVGRRVLRRAWRLLAGEDRNLPYQHTGAVMELVHQGETGSRTDLPGNTYALRSYGAVELKREEQDRKRVPYYIYPLEVPGSTFIPELDLTVHADVLPRDHVPDPRSLPPAEALLDLAKLPAQVFVRRRLGGDVFQPLGQNAALKLKTFLINQKVPREERDRVPLVSAPEEIIWAGGIRPGENYKIDHDTAWVLHLKMVDPCDQPEE